MAEENIQETTPEEKEKVNKFIQWFKDHPKTVFWVRFVLWVLFAVAGPVGFIIWRFELFTNVHTSFGGWGIIAIIIIVAFIISLLNYIKQGLAKYTFVGQCITGLCKVILPLVTLLIIVVSIKDNVSAFIQALGCTIAFESIGIIVNPMPKWIATHLTQEQQDKLNGLGDVLWDKYFSRKDKEDKK